MTLQAGDINSTRARADGILSGNPNDSITVPDGYQAYDLKGNQLDSIPLNDKGRAIVEVKTGKAKCSGNQTCVYNEAVAGNAVGKGDNAIKSGVGVDSIAPDSVVILRKL